MKKSKKWIQKFGIKKEESSKELGSGKFVKFDSRKAKVTKLLERRATLALNLKRLRNRR